MSRSETNINYPPGEILNPTLGKPDYEYVVLWMLQNNDVCEWSDFTAEISESTLSGHLKKLKDKHYIEKPEKGKYLITAQGKERFDELLFDKKSGKRSLRYPPKLILKKRNYDHWILWVLYNNYSAKWSDFKQEPLSINQSSLSNNLNSLIENGFVKRENKEYVITPLGKTEYFTVLKQYDLDRQSILEQESRRIEEVTEKTRDFFKRHKIEDDELKFRYIDYILKLNYSQVDSILKNEEDFNKILLFLSINHPNHYPDYINPEEFSVKYGIDGTTLSYYVKEIVENQFFPIKFFKLEDEQGRIYYFQKNEPLEKILNAIVEKYITKITYLNKFQEDPTIDIESLLEKVLNDACANLFNENLKSSLKVFIPEYIKYLAYKIETETKLIDGETKLEGFVWQNIFEEFQTFEPLSQPAGTIDDNEPFYSLDKKIFEVLNIAYLSKLIFINTKEVIKTYNFSRVELFIDLRKLLHKEKISKARELYEILQQDLDEIKQLILKDLITTAENDFEESIKITTELLDKFPEEFIGYLLQSLTYLLMDDYDKASEIVEIGLKRVPNVLLTCQKIQVLIKQNKWEKAQKIISEQLSTHPDNAFLLRSKFWVNINEWYYGIRDPNATLETITSAIKLNPNEKELLILKSLFYCKIDRFREAKRLLTKEIDINLLKKNPKIDSDVYLILATSYIARGKFEKALKIANQVLELYPNHPISYLTKALVFGYNLIYKFKFQEPYIETFIGLINRAIALNPIRSHQAIYLDFQGFVLFEIKEYDRAIETIERAIDLLPNQVFQYKIKLNFLMKAGRTEEGLEAVDKYVKLIPQFKKELFYQKSLIYWNNKQYEESFKVNNELFKLYPNAIDIANNRAIVLAALGRKEEAIKAAEHNLSIDPNHGNPYDTYGEILQTFGEYEKAIIKYEEALKKEPQGWFID
ncbi:MAG: tetratricopeptide repeat protein, partial [Promethearchaeota archaeon]